MINDSPTSVTAAGIDLKLLSQFIREFNILRRHFASYPQGHPLVESYLTKVAAMYGALMELSDTIVLAVTKDSLMLGAVVLEKGEPAFREFARSMFAQGIAAVTLRPGLTVEDLKRILIILKMKREDCKASGGIEKLWSDSLISSVTIRPLLYDAFTLTEDGVIGGTSEGLWERLAQGLVNDTLDAEGTGAFYFDPEVLAEMFEGNYDDFSSVPSQVMDFLLNAESSTSSVARNPALYQKLASFVSHLNPELREQFLKSSFSASRSDGSYPVADIISFMPAEQIIGLLEDVNSHRLAMPRVLLELVHNLAAQKKASPSAERGKVDHQELIALFNEHAWEQFIPSEYQRKLSRLLAEKEAPKIPGEVGSLIDTLQPTEVEHRVGKIVLQLAGMGGNTEDLDLLAQSMEEMCLFFVQTGDFREVLEIIRKAADPYFPIVFRKKVTASMGRREFVEEILLGLTTWGKSRYDDISALITAIGAPCVGPLLDRLAVEESISLRRFLIGRLIALGTIAREPILGRLDDHRWYFVRNLIIILRSLHDPTLAPHIRPLLKHPHDVISQEALRTLQEFGDPMVDRRILLDMESGTREVQLAAVQAAGRSKATDVFHALLALACKGGLSPAEVELRSAAIKALGDLGKPQALEELSRILSASSLLRGKALMRLKLDVVRSLVHYPGEEAIPLLAPLARRNDALGTLAAETLRSIKVRMHEH